MVSQDYTIQWHCHHHPSTYPSPPESGDEADHCTTSNCQTAQRSLTNPVVSSCLEFWFEIDGPVIFSWDGTGVTTALWNLNPLRYPVDNEKRIFPITMFSGCVAKNNHETRKQLANFLQFKQLKGAVTCQIQRAQKVLLKASNMHGVAVLSIVRTTDQRNSLIQMLIFSYQITDEIWEKNGSCLIKILWAWNLQSRIFLQNSFEW